MSTSSQSFNETASVDETKERLLEMVSNGDVINVKKFVNKYIEDHPNNSELYNYFNKLFCGMPSKYCTLTIGTQWYEIKRYALSSLCLMGNQMALTEFGNLYSGYDGDEMDIMKIPGIDTTVAIILLTLANTTPSRLRIVYMCTLENTKFGYFDNIYPKKKLYDLIKTNLQKAIELYDKPIDNPKYYEDIGYIFDYVPACIVADIIRENPDFIKYIPKMPDMCDNC